VEIEDQVLVEDYMFDLAHYLHDKFTSLPTAFLHSLLCLLRRLNCWQSIIDVHLGVKEAEKMLTQLNQLCLLLPHVINHLSKDSQKWKASSLVSFILDLIHLCLLEVDQSIHYHPTLKRIGHILSSLTSLFDIFPHLKQETKYIDTLLLLHKQRVCWLFIMHVLLPMETSAEKMKERILDFKQNVLQFQLHRAEIIEFVDEYLREQRNHGVSEHLLLDFLKQFIAEAISVAKAVIMSCQDSEKVDESKSLLSCCIDVTLGELERGFPFLCDSFWCSSPRIIRQVLPTPQN